MIDTIRHHQVFDPNNFHLPVHIVGCGGMGSHIAIALTRMGVGRHQSEIILHDYDLYEGHNLANQAIQIESVGAEKVFGLEQQMRYIEPDVNVVSTPCKVERGTQLNGIVFLCLDSMEDRAEIVEHCIEGSRDVKFVFETRMDAQTGIVYSFNPNNHRHMDCWWMYWYPSGHTEITPGCGGPQSIISAIYGTSCLALKQFELYARKKSRKLIQNRIYSDFLDNKVVSERWPT